MRTVAELRAIDAEKRAWLDANFAADDPMRDAQIDCEPRYWMDFEEWCEFVESGENFTTMERRERAARAPAALLPASGGAWSVVCALCGGRPCAGSSEAACGRSEGSGACPKGGE